MLKISENKAAANNNNKAFCFILKYMFWTTKLLAVIPCGIISQWEIIKTEQKGLVRRETTEKGIFNQQGKLQFFCSSFKVKQVKN